MPQMVIDWKQHDCRHFFILFMMFRVCLYPLSLYSVSFIFLEGENAITTSGLQTTLSGAGPMTLLAPTDTAITAYGDDKWTTLSTNSANLKRALEVHVLDSHILSGDSKIDIRILDSNQANYTATDIEASNGIIHLVDTVISRRGPFPGLPSVGAHGYNLENYSYLLQVLFRHPLVIHRLIFFHSLKIRQ